MFRAVALQPFLHPVGQPQQGDLAQCGEVADPEVVSEGGLDPVRRIDVAMDHAAAERLRWQVDQFDLVGPAGHLVGQGLPLRDARDLPHHVVEGLQVLDIERGDNIDADVQELLHVLPPLGVADSRNVGVGQLVDQCDLGAAGQDRVEIHLGEERTAVAQRTAGHRLQAVGHGRGRPTAMRLDEADDHIRTPCAQPLTLGEHGVRLPDPGAAPR